MVVVLVRGGSVSRNAFHTFENDLKHSSAFRQTEEEEDRVVWVWLLL